MLGTLNALFAATVLFVGGHFILSSKALRVPLSKRLGSSRFLGLYSIAVGASFVWMLIEYGRAPWAPVWTPPSAFGWIPIVVMPFALILVVAGLTTRSPTAVGGDSQLDMATASTRNPTPGILRITRHPFLWGASLWAASHLAVNGDAASIIFMGGILILSLVGMHHIDARREATLGSAWGPIALTTSAIPFAAILSHRTAMDWRGLGWWRPALGLVLYALTLHAHPLFFGVSALPPVSAY